VCGEDVDHGHGQFGRGLRRAGHADVAALGLQHHVVRGALGIVRIADDVAVHQPWVQRAQARALQAQLGGIGREVVADQHIGIGDQRVHFGLARRVLQIDRTMLLAVVHAAEIGAHGTSRILLGQLPLAGDITAGAGVLDLHHVGAQFGQEHAHGGARQHTGRLHHTQAFERSLRHAANVRGPHRRRVQISLWPIVRLGAKCASM
jgi:hypothetical protein